METHPVPPGVDSDVDSGRGTFRGEALFLIRLLRLSLVLGFEYIYYLSYGAFFLFLRRSYRERMRRLVLGTGGALAAAVLLALLIGGPGCSSPQSQEPVNPRSFKAQLREMRWSMWALANQSDSKESLKEDLRALGPDNHWREDLRFSIQSIIRMDDAKKSLESDLKDFGDPDYKEHGLQETFELWGF